MLIIQAHQNSVQTGESVKFTRVRSSNGDLLCTQWGAQHQNVLQLKQTFAQRHQQRTTDAQPTMASERDTWSSFLKQLFYYHTVKVVQIRSWKLGLLYYFVVVCTLGTAQIN